MKTLVTVISCSDRAVVDPAEDRAGGVLRAGLADLGFAVGSPVVVKSEVSAIRGAVVDALVGGARVVFTTGGTGLLPRDVTVEATAPLLDYELPGIMEEVRRLGAQKTALSLLSRGLVGVCSPDKVRGAGGAEGAGPTAGTLPRALVVNAPGSRGGARDTLAVIGPVLGRIIDSLDGVDHDMSRPASKD